MAKVANAQILAGGFASIKRIAKGGAAEILECTTTSGRAVAVKRPFQCATNDSQWEAKVLGALGAHPNIVRMLGTIEMDGLPCIALELAQSTVHDQIQYRRSLPEAEAARHIHSLLSALAHMSAMGLMHLDVHTRNLLLFSTPEGVVLKLADFGIVRTRGDNGTVALPPGTPGFRAPEWILSGAGAQEDRCLEWINAWCLDVWAVGKVFMTMLVGDELCVSRPEITEAAAGLALVEGNTEECPTNPGEADLATLKRIVCMRSGRRHRLARDWLRGLASKATVHLIEQMLCRDPNLRPSPQQLLASNVFSGNSPVMMEVSDVPEPLQAPLARFDMRFPSELDTNCMPLFGMGACVRRRQPGSPTDGSTPLRRQARTMGPGAPSSAARRL
eukprot:Hpha_TRINITY_DN15522_c1_g2::TRINITY_DN15522_c1_g2_i2::g.108109::m.108109